MTINLIACVSSNGAIGYKNNLLFHIKEDMKHFQKLSKGQICVMGRNTFESILLMNNGEPLRNRISVVLTSQKDYQVPTGVFVFDSIDKIIQHHETNSDSDKNICVIGGSDVYASFLDSASNVFLTIVNRHVEEVDTYFPMELLHENFHIAEESEDHYSEKYDAYYKFVRYAKNQNKT